MEEKYSDRHCIGKMRHNCTGCKKQLKCVLITISLIAKRFVLLVKKCVMRMFTRTPKEERSKERLTLQHIKVYAVGSCLLATCLISFFLPIFGMNEVQASDQVSSPAQVVVGLSLQEDAYALEENVDLTSEAIVPEFAEVATDVVKQASETVVGVTVNDLPEPEAIQPVEEKESLEDVMAEYDIPLDYDVELAFMGMDYLINEQGFSVAGAAGVMGNFYAECRFDSSLIGGSHKGLAQWDSTYRWPMIAEWLNENGYDLTSFMGQMNAIFYSDDAREFTSGNPYRTFDKMREATDPRSAAMTWLYEYERAPGQGEQTRQDMAELTYELYSRTR